MGSIKSKINRCECMNDGVRCKNTKMGKKYCYIHKCKLSCNNMALPYIDANGKTQGYFKYCLKHSCKFGICKNCVVNNGPYCGLHSLLIS